jgi:hypothetical protein
METVLLIAGIVSLLVQGLRKLPLTAPLWQRIPDGLRWAVPLLLAMLGTAAESLISGAAWPQVISAALTASVVAWLASMGVAAAGAEAIQGAKK